MIALSTLTKGERSDSYVDSLLRTLDDRKDVQVVAAPASVNTLSLQRNRVAEAVLESDAEHLLFVDSDMGWPTDALDRLLETGLPVVGGLCFGIQFVAPDGTGGFSWRPFPTLFDFVNDSYEIRWDYPRDQVTQVSATGAAFLLIHRDVLERSGPNWFDRAIGPDGELLGEDLSFCHRLAELGIPVHVHTGVKVSHYKPVWLSEETYVGYRVHNAMRKGAR